MDDVVAAIGALRPATVAGRPMLKQAVVLLWALGRARAGSPRLLGWADTEAALAPLLREHRRPGERARGRPDYPIAALCRAGLWDLAGHAGDVPPAHGDAALRTWFAAHAPDGGLPSRVYDLVRGSGRARLLIIEAVSARFLGDLDDTSLLTAVGLHDEDVAAGGFDPAGTSAEYVRLCALVARRGAPGRRSRRSEEPIRLAAARGAVLLRSEGRCENPGCGRPAPDVTDRGDPILQVDHVRPLAEDGRDDPAQMIALCPDCHAVKTLGRTRHELVPTLLRTARERHDRWSA